MATIPYEKESSLDSIPKTPEEAREKKELAKQKESFQVQNGSEMELAKSVGLPSELADMFFMKLGGKPYIKVAGLQFMAGKIGYQRIEVSSTYDAETETWNAEAKIYPKIGNHTLASIAKLKPELQDRAFDELSKPTNGLGSANTSNVQNASMHKFLREMAQTRAMGRALRAFTGYGSAVYEELPEAEIKVE